MQFGWKVLIPVSLLWILVVATLRIISTTSQSRPVTFGFAGVVVLIVLAISTAFENSKKKRDAAVHPEAAEPNFAVPSLPSEITTINVSNQGGDRG
jgi:NADH-quinone oxidoreductase subunit H